MSSLADQLTVAIAAYNSDETLPLTLRSIKKAFKLTGNTRVILVDDGSQPPLTQMNPQLLTQDWIEVHRIENNQGLSNARNFAVGLCTTPWISFVDSDDVIAEDHFLLISKYLNSSYSAIVPRSTRRYLGDKPTTAIEEPERRSLIPLRILKENFMTGSSTYRISTVNSVGGWRSEVTDDWDFWIRFFRKEHAAIRLSRPTYMYTVNASSLSNLPSSRLLRILTLRVAIQEAGSNSERLILRSTLLWTRTLLVRNTVQDATQLFWWIRTPLYKALSFCLLMHDVVSEIMVLFLARRSLRFGAIDKT